MNKIGGTIDLLGQRFGKLLVVSYAGSGGNRGALWNCRCDCGNDHIVTGGNLRHSTKSCGCITREKYVAPNGTLEELLQNIVVDPNTGCHVWQRATNSFGHGALVFDGVQWLAHRLAWTLANGPIPKGKYVLHRCDNPPCINLEHLWLGDNRDNVADMVAKKRHARGQWNGGAKLTNDQVQQIRKLLDEGVLTQIEIAEKFGITQTTVSNIKRGISWGWLAWPNRNRGNEVAKIDQTQAHNVRNYDPFFDNL